MGFTFFYHCTAALDWLSSLLLSTPPPRSSCQPPPTRAVWLPSCCPSCVWSWSSTPAGVGANVVGSRSPRRVPALRPPTRSTTSHPCWWAVRPVRAWGTPAGRGPTPAAPSASGRRPFWTGKSRVWSGRRGRQIDCPLYFCSYCWPWRKVVIYNAESIASQKLLFSQDAPVTKVKVFRMEFQNVIKMIDDLSWWTYFDIIRTFETKMCKVSILKQKVICLESDKLEWWFVVFFF